MRRLVLLVALLAIAGCVEQPREIHSFATVRPEPQPEILPASAPAATMRRLPETLRTPFRLAPATAPTPPLPAASDAAPLPNRSIEAPRDLFVDRYAPRVEPMVLPSERRQGATFGSEHLRETGPDRALGDLMPGARVLIPFESSTQR